MAPPLAPTTPSMITLVMYTMAAGMTAVTTINTRATVRKPGVTSHMKRNTRGTMSATSRKERNVPCSGGWNWSVMAASDSPNRRALWWRVRLSQLLAAVPSI